MGSSISDLVVMGRSGAICAAPFAPAVRCRNCMSGPLSIVLWLGLVLIGIAAMQWGAARAADLLDILRGHWGLPATAGGTLMGLATASPEIAVNVTSVVFLARSRAWNSPGV